MSGRILPCPTGRSVQSANIIKDSKGTAVIVFTMLILVAFIFLNTGYVNYRYMLAKKDIADDAVTASALAALNANDPVKMAYGQISIDPVQAQSQFYDYLNQNLPQSKKINITIDDFRVYNGPDTAPDGTQIVNPSIYINATAAFSNLYGKNVRVRIKKVVDANYQL